jgi:hypothetical protein
VIRLALAILVAVLGTGCTLLQPEIPGETATWTFAPGQEIGPDTTEFVAMVTERNCASGQSSEGRIVGPMVDAHNDRVVVTFEVRPLGGEQTCPGNPPTAVTVRLGEAPGPRPLLDGGREPPSEPPECAAPEFCE